MKYYFLFFLFNSLIMVKAFGKKMLPDYCNFFYLMVENEKCRHALQINIMKNDTLIIFNLDGEFPLRNCDTRIIIEKKELHFEFLDSKYYFTRKHINNEYVIGSVINENKRNFIILENIMTKVMVKGEFVRKRDKWIMKSVFIGNE